MEEPATLEYATAPQDELARTMGLWALAIYGVGDMLGTGIYVLIGKAAGVMGSAVWLAFVVSMVAAMLTGLSYACIGSRHPKAAGAAYVTQRAFGLPFVSYVIGLAVMASGLTSMAAASRGFAGYAFGYLSQAFPALEGQGPAIQALLVLMFIGGLTFINFWGMRESTWLNLLCTSIEVGGLVFIIAIGIPFWGGTDYLQPPMDHSSFTLPLILGGAQLTFFSFIGFEDMLNVTEEVKNPQYNFPRALVVALVIVTIIYIAIAVTAVSVVPHAELAASKDPLVEVTRRAAPWFPPALFTAISLFAITNTALLNYIMGSRLAYGMARQGLLPAVLGKVHATRRTPHVAILTLMVIVTTLALAGDITALAKSTAALLLGAFMLMNLSLIVLKLRPNEPRGSFEVPIVVPMAGIAVCGLLLAFTREPDALKISGILLGVICVLYFALRPKNVVMEE